MNSSAIGFRDVTVRYGDRTAVDRVSLDIEAGSLTVLLGQSGSGKSTLLRTVNRLVSPQSGSVTVEGRNVATLPATGLRRGIGYVIQAVGLFPHLSVARNIAIVPELEGWSRERIAARVDDLLALMKLEPSVYRDRLPRALSGGEAQRVGVARALAAEPRVLLMDEPFGAVDPLVRAELQAETLRIQRTLGTTFLFVTHDVDEALRLADRVVVMHGGRVLQYGAPIDVLAHPAEAYVAGLLGTGDSLRKLRLIEAGTVARKAPPAPGAPRIGRSANLGDALEALLRGASEVNVADGSDSAGVVDFSDIRSALASL